MPSSAARESDEFQRQTALIREAWGEGAVPVCEAIPGVHHFGVLDDLADPHGRLHGLALRSAWVLRACIRLLSIGSVS